MKTIKSLSYIFLLSCALCSISLELEDPNFDDIRDIVGKNYSDDDLVKFVRDTLSKRDASTIDWVVNLLIEFSYLDKIPYGGYDRIYRERPFANIPGLKDVLIKKWVDNYENSGHNLRLSLIQSSGSSDGRTFSLPNSIMKDEKGELRDPKVISRLLTERIPAWIKVPIVLCAYWPGDTEVNALIWDFYSRDKSPDVVIQTLRWLNNGMFSTNRDNELRMEQLNRRDLKHPSEIVIIQLATQGLAYSRPIVAIPILIEAGLTYPRAQDDILFVLSKYEIVDMENHVSQLSSMLSIVDENKLLPMSRTQTSYVRLKSFINRIDEEGSSN